MKNNLVLAALSSALLTIAAYGGQSTTTAGGNTSGQSSGSSATQGTGSNSSKTWQGDQWKIGGGTTWGWYSYDPEAGVLYYGSGNPSTWDPNPRSHDKTQICKGC